MNKDLIIVILALAFAGAAAALLVTLAKLQEEKERRWDEISRAVSLENELEKSKVHQQWMKEDILRYSEQLTKEQALSAEREEEIFRLSTWNRIMQDRLSALLCPRNDHIWEDGVCKRCGRIEWKS